MASDRAGRWRASELRDDGSDEAEMTSVTKQRWRVRGSGGYEQAWAEMTKGTKRRWRVWGSSGHEQAWAEMTKESLVRWCRVMRKVLWVRPRWVYGRDNSTSATRDQQITHTNNLKIDIVDVGLPTSSTSTHRRRRHRLGGCWRGSTQVLKERKRRNGSVFWLRIWLIKL